MVYSEATIGMPLITGYAYHKGSWKGRKSKDFQKLFFVEKTLA
jgi:deoxyhypusine synthase